MSHHILSTFPTRRSSDLVRRKRGSAAVCLAAAVYEHNARLHLHAVWTLALACLLQEDRALPFEEAPKPIRSEEHTSELQSPCNLVCRLLLEKKKNLSHYD